MPIQSGTKLGPYEVVSAVGAGGMGEVYQAKDLRLERLVAIKVLPSHLSSNADLRARFEREAKVISGLQHPNICVLFDVGQHDGFSYLVMEFLEGETLATRIARKPLTTDEALRIGIDIADALEKAHQQGVVHRDLKPGNVMLTKEGAKLMDFGLAKPAAFASAAGASAPSFTAAATMTSPHSPITMAGSVVGTVQYMSPEQVQGQEVDARSDIFSFGAMLYEMVTGKRAFEGKSQLSVASAILEKEPEPISAVQPLCPPALDHVIKACIAKESAERWQSIADVKRGLLWIQEGGSRVGLPAAVKSHRKWRERALWIAGLVLALAIAPAVYWLTRPAPPPQIRASLTMPDGMTLGRPGAFAISPDGKRLAFVAQPKGGKYQLFVRALDSLEAQPLANTEDASYPFWSPDSQTVAFFIPGKLKKIDAGGGAVTTLCDAEDGRGGTWNQAGAIVFAPKPDAALWRVDAAGGQAVEVVKRPAPTGYSLRWPQFLPDGEHVLYLQMPLGSTSTTPDTGVYVADLSGGKPQRLVAEHTSVSYADGRLLFVREQNLMAQHFDPGKRTLQGEAVPIVEKIGFEAARGMAAYSLSGTGLLIHSASENDSQIQWAWIDAEGRPGEKVGEPGSLIVAQPSPDGKRVLFTQRDQKGEHSLWMYDVERKVSTRFTFGDRSASQWGGVWSPDSRRIVFASNREAAGRWDIYIKDASGSQPEQVLYKGPYWGIPVGWSPDGKHIAVTSDSKETKWDILLVTVDGEKKTSVLQAGKGNDVGALFSSDGRWFSYQTDESGRFESYIASVSNPSSRWQISANGGYLGVFCSTKHFVYETAEQKLMLVGLDLSGPEPKIGQSRPAFGGADTSNYVDQFTTADCGRLLAGSRLRTSTPRLTLVTNWTAKLKK